MRFRLLKPQINHPEVRYIHTLYLVVNSLMVNFCMAKRLRIYELSVKGNVREWPLHVILFKLTSWMKVRAWNLNEHLLTSENK